MNITHDSATSATDHSELLFANFNQDSGCFACGTTNGFIIYNVEPFRETFRRIFPNGGIGIIEMLFRCNLLAIVGGGRNPRYPTNKVMIWDDHQNKCIGELKFRTEVKAVKLRRDRIVVVLETKVFVYRFKDLKLLDQITTVSNPKGLVSLCYENKNNVLAIPGLAKGSIRIELYDNAKATLIKAHDADLAQFVLNYDGSRIASASEKGTLIRLWNCYTGEPLRELRRGMDRADIYCLAFNSASTYLACSSDKGTVHIFSLAGPPPPAPGTAGSSGVSGGKMGGEGEVNSPPPAPYHRSPSTASSTSRQDTSAAFAAMSLQHAPSERDSYSAAGPVGSNSPNPAGANANNSNNNGSNKSMNGMGMHFLKGILPSGLVPKYFESEWSFAQIRGIEGKSVCAFSKDSSKLHIICSDGHFIIANVEEGECNRVSTIKYLKHLHSHSHLDDLSGVTGGSGVGAGTGGSSGGGAGIASAGTGSSGAVAGGEMEYDWSNSHSITGLSAASAVGSGGGSAPSSYIPPSQFISPGGGSSTPKL
jgi:hypothetical protein